MFVFPSARARVHLLKAVLHNYAIIVCLSWGLPVAMLEVCRCRAIVKRHLCPVQKRYSLAKYFILRCEHSSAKNQRMR